MFSGLMRARRAQEDRARGAMQRARQEAAVAAERVRVYEAALDSRRLPDAARATAYAASLAARHATAGMLSAAIGVAALADATVLDRTAELTEAAVKRRAVERLLERKAEEARRAEEAAAQRELDEIAARAQPRDRRRTDR